MSHESRQVIKVAYRPDDRTGRQIAAFRFDLGAADLIADDTYADHANYHQHGVARHLWRTTTGRWAWQIETQWVGDYDRYVAATDADGVPFEADDVEDFISRYGSASDIELWRIDIGKPLPLV